MHCLNIDKIIIQIVIQTDLLSVIKVQINIKVLMDNKKLYLPMCFIVAFSFSHVDYSLYDIILNDVLIVNFIMNCYMNKNFVGAFFI